MLRQKEKHAKEELVTTEQHRGTVVGTVPSEHDVQGLDPDQDRAALCTELHILPLFAWLRSKCSSSPRVDSQ